MATEFLRLYRDLTKQDIDKPIEDFSFGRERKLLLTKFGHTVGNSPERVRPCKNHGKTARLRQHEARQKAIMTKSGAEIERMRNLRETMSAMDQQYESNMELKALLEQGLPIPNKLYRKLFGVTGKAEGSDRDRIGLKPRQKSLRCLPTIPRKPTADVKDHTVELGRLSKGCGNDGRDGSNHKWTKGEVVRLTAIYWELVIPQPLSELPPSPHKQSYNQKQSQRGRPSPYGSLSADTGGDGRRSHTQSSFPTIHTSNFNSTGTKTHQRSRPGSSNATAELKLAWQNYYFTFAKRFQLFFPHRRTNDIIAKVQEFLKTHRFKEKGEREYWASPTRLQPWLRDSEG